MHKEFIEEINFQVSKKIKSKEEIDYLLQKKFGKVFVKNRLEELKFLINYTPFFLIHLDVLKDSILKFLKDDVDFQSLLSKGIYSNGIHKVKYIDSQLVRSKLFLLGYLNYYELVGEEYLIKFDFFAELSQINGIISLDEFKGLQKKKEELGNRGEVFVLNLEKNRLPGMPVVQTSLYNTSAGYDILSFKEFGNLDFKNQLMIEVKTFKNSFQIYISENEYLKHKASNGNHIFKIVKENDHGELMIYKTIENLEEFISSSNCSIKVIPTYKIDLI
jgi:hypothetical protein